MHVLVCDDNPLHAGEIARQAAEVLPSGANAEISFCTTGAQVLERLGKQKDGPWIILLDILFPDGEDGIRIAQEINQAAPRAQIIFITGEMAQCTKAGRAEHIYFLVKPIDTQELRYAMEKAARKLADTYLPLEGRRGKLQVPVSNILYLERIGRRTFVHTSDQVYDVAEKLDVIHERIDPYLFVTPHKSFLVNFSHVTAITPREFIMDNQERVPISHLRHSEVKQKYLEYVRRKL